MENANKNIPPRELTRESWFELLKMVSEKAVEEAFEQGLPITILRDRKIIQLFPDQHIEVLEELPKVDRLSDRKIFKIKPETTSQD